MDVESDSGFMATHDKPGQNYAKFYLHPVLNKKKTKEAGRDIYEDQVYILILCPGQTRSEFRAPAQEAHKRLYKQAWADFQNGQKEPTVSGTPIEYLPTVTPARAKELRALNIYTVEQMATCPDTAAAEVGFGFNTLKNAANAYITKNSPEVAALKAQVAELTAKLEQIMKDKPKRGRPAKAELQAAA